MEPHSGILAPGVRDPRHSLRFCRDGLDLWEVAWGAFDSPEDGSLVISQA